MSSQPRVKFLAVAHDRKIVESYLHWDKENSEKYEETLMQIFTSSGWSAVQNHSKRKLELKSGKNTYCIEIDDMSRVFVVVVTADFPIHHVFSSSHSNSPRIMNEFMSFVEENSRFSTNSSHISRKGLRSYMKSLATRFSSLDRIVKISEIEGRINGTVASLNKALIHASKSEAVIQDLQERSAALETSSLLMSSTASSIQRKRCCQAYKMYIIVGCTILLVLAVIGIILGVVIGGLSE